MENKYSNLEEDNVPDISYKPKPFTPNKNLNTAISSRTLKGETKCEDNKKDDGKKSDENPESESDDPAICLSRLQRAVVQNRFPFDKITSVEFACFPDLAVSTLEAVKIYLRVRNDILQKWKNNPNKAAKCLFKQFYCRNKKNVMCLF